MLPAADPNCKVVELALHAINDGIDEGFMSFEQRKEEVEHTAAVKHMLAGSKKMSRFESSELMLYLSSKILMMGR